MNLDYRCYQGFQNRISSRPVKSNGSRVTVHYCKSPGFQPRYIFDSNPLALGFLIPSLHLRQLLHLFIHQPLFTLALTHLHPHTQLTKPHNGQGNTFIAISVYNYLKSNLTQQSSVLKSMAVKFVWTSCVTTLRTS